MGFSHTRKRKIPLFKNKYGKFPFWGYNAPMIPFNEIDLRLDGIKQNRAWLATVTGRSPDSIRSALAPNSPPKNRTALLQKALSDAIEKEEELRLARPRLPDRITIECEPSERRKWSQAADSKGANLDSWIVEELNQAAEAWLSLTPMESAERPDAQKQG